MWFKDIIFGVWVLLSFISMIALLYVSNRVGFVKSILHYNWIQIDSIKYKNKYLKMFYWILDIPTCIYKGILKEPVTKKNTINDHLKNFSASYINLKLKNFIKLKKILSRVNKVIFSISNIILKMIQLIKKNVFTSMSYLAFSMSIVGFILQKIHCLNDTDISYIKDMSENISIIGSFMLLFIFVIFVTIAVNKFVIHFSKNNKKKLDIIILVVYLCVVGMCFFLIIKPFFYFILFCVFVAFIHFYIK